MSEQLIDKTVEQVTEQPEARSLFRAAYENRYTWDEQFPGYTADVVLKEGDQTYKGKLKIYPKGDGNLAHEVTEVSDEAAKKALMGQAWEIAIHRVRNTFEQSHGENRFTLGETDETGAVEIFVSGKAMGDRYKVRNNEVSLVHRHIHNVVVTINTFGSHQTGQGYLSHRYDSVYHDAQTGEQKGSQVFEDEYENVGGYYILSRRSIQAEQDGQQTTSEFLFSNIELLK
ncbi:DUF3386 domain-containing protein [Phormidium tenue FACHB-886]|nr:DUF3386 domain-containing protein [Phormidium tenue FACHB-886]